jgi:type I restriction enzyme S subunit
VPPQQILNQFDSKARPLLEAIFANTEECAVLAQLRDTLLPKLISGDLRIADAARFIEEGAV